MSIINNNMKRADLTVLIVVLVLVLVGVYLILNFSSSDTSNKEANKPKESMVENQGEEAAKASQDLINEAKEKQEKERMCWSEKGRYYYIREVRHCRL